MTLLVVTVTAHSAAFRIQVTPFTTYRLPLPYTRWLLPTLPLRFTRLCGLLPAAATGYRFTPAGFLPRLRLVCCSYACLYTPYPGLPARTRSAFHTLHTVRGSPHICVHAHYTGYLVVRLLRPAVTRGSWFTAATFTLRCLRLPVTCCLFTFTHLPFWFALRFCGYPAVAALRLLPLVTAFGLLLRFTIYRVGYAEHTRILVAHTHHGCTPRLLPAHRTRCIHGSVTRFVPTLPGLQFGCVTRTFTHTRVTTAPLYGSASTFGYVAVTFYVPARFTGLPTRYTRGLRGLPFPTPYAFCGFWFTSYWLPVYTVTGYAVYRLPVLRLPFTFCTRFTRLPFGCLDYRTVPRHCGSTRLPHTLVRFTRSPPYTHAVGLVTFITAVYTCRIHAAILPLVTVIPGCYPCGYGWFIALRYMRLVLPTRFYFTVRSAVAVYTRLHATHRSLHGSAVYGCYVRHTIYYYVQFLRLVLPFTARLPHCCYWFTTPHIAFTLPPGSADYSSQFYHTTRSLHADLPFGLRIRAFTHTLHGSTLPFAGSFTLPRFTLPFVRARVAALPGLPSSSLPAFARSALPAVGLVAAFTGLRGYRVAAAFLHVLIRGCSRFTTHCYILLRLRLTTCRLRLYTVGSLRLVVTHATAHIVAVLPLHLYRCLYRFALPTYPYRSFRLPTFTVLPRVTTPHLHHFVLPVVWFRSALVGLPGWFFGYRTLHLPTFCYAHTVLHCLRGCVACRALRFARLRSPPHRVVPPVLPFATFSFTHRVHRCVPYYLRFPVVAVTPFVTHGLRFCRSALPPLVLHRSPYRHRLYLLHTFPAARFAFCLPVYLLHLRLDFFTGWLHAVGLRFCVRLRSPLPGYPLPLLRFSSVGSGSPRRAVRFTFAFYCTPTLPVTHALRFTAGYCGSRCRARIAVAPFTVLPTHGSRSIPRIHFTVACRSLHTTGSDCLRLPFARCAVYAVRVPARVAAAPALLWLWTRTYTAAFAVRLHAFTAALVTTFGWFTYGLLTRLRARIWVAAPHRTDTRRLRTATLRTVVCGSVTAFCCVYTYCSGLLTPDAYNCYTQPALPVLRGWLHTTVWLPTLPSRLRLVHVRGSIYPHPHAFTHVHGYCRLHARLRLHFVHVTHVGYRYTFTRFYRFWLHAHGYVCCYGLLPTAFAVLLAVTAVLATLYATGRWLVCTRYYGCRTRCTRTRLPRHYWITFSATTFTVTFTVLRLVRAFGWLPPLRSAYPHGSVAALPHTVAAHGYHSLPHLPAVWFGYTVAGSAVWFARLVTALQFCGCVLLLPHTVCGCLPTFRIGYVACRSALLTLHSGYVHHYVPRVLGYALRFTCGSTFWLPHTFCGYLRHTGCLVGSLRSFGYAVTLRTHVARLVLPTHACGSRSCLRFLPRFYVCYWFCLHFTFTTFWLRGYVTRTQFCTIYRIYGLPAFTAVTHTQFARLQFYALVLRTFAPLLRGSVLHGSRLPRSHVAYTLRVALRGSTRCCRSLWFARGYTRFTTVGWLPPHTVVPFWFTQVLHTPAGIHTWLRLRLFTVLVHVPGSTRLLPATAYRLPVPLPLHGSVTRSAAGSLLDCVYGCTRFRFWLPFAFCLRLFTFWILLRYGYTVTHYTHWLYTVTRFIYRGSAVLTVDFGYAFTIYLPLLRHTLRILLHGSRVTRLHAHTAVLHTFFTVPHRSFLAVVPFFPVHLLMRSFTLLPFWLPPACWLPFGLRALRLVLPFGWLRFCHTVLRFRLYGSAVAVAVPTFCCRGSPTCRVATGYGSGYHTPVVAFYLVYTTRSHYRTVGSTPAGYRSGYTHVHTGLVTAYAVAQFLLLRFYTHTHYGCAALHFMPTRLYRGFTAFAVLPQVTQFCGYTTWFNFAVLPPRLHTACGCTVTFGYRFTAHFTRALHAAVHFAVRTRIWFTGWLHCYVLPRFAFIRFRLHRFCSSPRITFTYARSPALLPTVGYHPAFTHVTARLHTRGLPHAARGYAPHGSAPAPAFCHSSYRFTVLPFGYLAYYVRFTRLRVRFAVTDTHLHRGLPAAYAYLYPFSRIRAGSRYGCAVALRARLHAGGYYMPAGSVLPHLVVTSSAFVLVLVYCITTPRVYCGLPFPVLYACRTRFGSVGLLPHVTTRFQLPVTVHTCRSPVVTG